MPSRAWRDRLQDMLSEADFILQTTAGMDYEQFVDDEICQRAIRHAFCIIGEAARAVPPWLHERYPAVAWRLAADMRNFTIHVYWRVDNNRVWDAVQVDLPRLRTQLLAILEAEADA